MIHLILFNTSGSLNSMYRTHMQSLLKSDFYQHVIIIADFPIYGMIDRPFSSMKTRDRTIFIAFLIGNFSLILVHWRSKLWD